MTKKNWTGWFEIPVSDFDRAKKFYENIFEIEIHTIDLGVLKMGIFPHTETIGCAICQGEEYQPSKNGTKVYLNANPDLKTVLNRIENEGGKVIQGKKPISSEFGFMALFEDCEGNYLALHSEA
ncbi:MAG: VOC family protein [Bacteroidetes bacterium]|jgi:predicted enzyme related to lactoylglutathione lyase|nr:VOC family protein [Bacteroidota bacterium]MDF1863198.1 VOC family protein [Saprospiraceae bacterium]